MSEFFICNKYIYIYIYIYICLFHFVANEEKLLIRYNGGEKKWEWEFTLLLETEGGKEFYNRLKTSTYELNLVFCSEENVDYLYMDYSESFPSLIQYTPTEKINYSSGDITSTANYFYIYLSTFSDQEEKIGYIKTEGFAENIKTLIGENSNINLEFALEKHDTTKIAEINKKIIIAIIIGLSILIIFIILKFIV